MFIALGLSQSTLKEVHRGQYRHGSCWEVCAAKLISRGARATSPRHLSQHNASQRHHAMSNEVVPNATIPNGILDNTQSPIQLFPRVRLQYGLIDSLGFVLQVGYMRLGLDNCSVKRAGPRLNWNLMERQRRMMDRHSKRDKDEERTSVTQKINHRSASPAAAADALWLDTHWQ